MDEIEIRATTFGYVIVGVILGPLVLLYGYNVVSHRTGLLPLLYPATLLILAWLWLSAFRIQVRSGRLIYRTLFGRAQISLSGVTSAAFESGVQRRSDVLRSWRRLRLSSVNGLHSSVFINTTVFKRADILRLLSILEAYNVKLKRSV
jgi:hypothetical protein